MRRKIIVSNEITKQREFISIAFSPTDDKKLVTLTENSHDQQQIFIWQWDKAKCHTQQLVPNSGSNGWGTQVSFSNFDEKSLLVTGPQTFKFFKIQDTTNLKATQNGLQKKEQHISSNYTAHAWLPDNRILVGTDSGDIIICESDGTYKLVLH